MPHRPIGLAAAATAAIVALASAGLPRPAFAQSAPPGTVATPAPDSATAARRKPWHERISVRGYGQVRYNRLLETNPELRCTQCDRSLGPDGGLFLRRVRVVISGDVSDRVSIYLQPDFASELDGSLYVGQLRDAYADVALDRARTLRVRIGQSKIPFGWENMQSSAVRVALDRADALNSALPNERDVAAILYWAPAAIRERFRILVDSGYKGSGDYGVVGLGAFNGQGTSRPEANGALHTVARVSWPFRLASGQFVEAGLQGYTGRFVLPASQRTSGVTGPAEFADERVAATFVVYPQPFGLQAEWNVGRGPEVDPAARVVDERRLSGGYVQATYRGRIAGQPVIPFARAHRYDGGKKFETDARSHSVREVEIGAEWLPTPAFELTAMWARASRRYEDAATPENRQRGSRLRLQAQFNF